MCSCSLSRCVTPPLKPKPQTPNSSQGVELDASCFARKSLLAFAALAGLNPSVIIPISVFSFVFVMPLQRAGNLAASATLHAFHILRQLYECITPGCARLQKRTVTVEDAKLALEGRAEFGVDLPPPPVGLAPDKQQQVEELRSRFAANPKRQLFLNSGSAAANAFRYTARKFFQEYGGGSVCAKTKTFSQKKGGFMLHDSLVVELQAVVAARLVWHFHGYVNDAVETGVGAQLVAQ